ncbi:hypothetical protein VNO80_22412 [Phaseolus coccineus]|uniref:N-acetyltransferase domain-containing protein n=1 Tax=Phaseolus coccineus TaxID=3886 RepID=A0AAN9MAF6_PHACN
MPSISSTIHVPHFHNSSSSKWPRIAVSLPMTTDSDFLIPKKKKEVSVQLSTLKPPVSRLETVRFCNFNLGRFQPSPQELEPHDSFEFGDFVAREALLDEEYWIAAWLRAENEWKDRRERYHTDKEFAHYRKKIYARKEFAKIKKRCKEPQHGQSSTCIITEKKQQKDIKRIVLRSVVGTLDLNIRYLLQGETFPGELVDAPRFCKIDRTPTSRYGYIENLCVAKSYRRKAIASNMLSFTVEYAKSRGVERLYVHVDTNNDPAVALYQKLGFEVVENPLLIKSPYDLLRLQM